jgi:transposase
VALAQDFASLIRQRQPTQLEPGLRRAATSALPPFRRLAKGLWADMAAVQAAVTLPWRQGPIEGQINRLKRLKRQMFGRAHLDLLARRFLLAPHAQRPEQRPQEPAEAQAQLAAA